MEGLLTAAILTVHLTVIVKAAPIPAVSKFAPLIAEPLARLIKEAQNPSNIESGAEREDNPRFNTLPSNHKVEYDGGSFGSSVGSGDQHSLDSEWISKPDIISDELEGATNKLEMEGTSGGFFGGDIWDVSQDDGRSDVKPIISGSQRGGETDPLEDTVAYVNEDGSYGGFGDSDGFGDVFYDKDEPQINGGFSGNSDSQRKVQPQPSFTSASGFHSNPVRSDDDAFVDYIYNDQDKDEMPLFKGFGIVEDGSQRSETLSDGKSKNSFPDLAHYLQGDDPTVVQSDSFGAWGDMSSKTTKLPTKDTSKTTTKSTWGKPIPFTKQDSGKPTSSVHTIDGFSRETKDCKDIDTKTCTSNAECSCFGLYTCMSGACLTTTPPKPSTDTSGGQWGTPFNPSSLGGTVDGSIVSTSGGDDGQSTSIGNSWGGEWGSLEGGFVGKK